LPASSSIRPSALLALALALAALVALPAKTLAQTHKVGCRPPASATAQHKHGAPVCVPSKHSATAKKDAKSRSKASSKRRRHAHARRVRRHARRRGTGKQGSATTRSLAVPVCEDGTAPTSAGSGSFACDDGSEPECESGATPVLAKGGSTLLCAATVGAGRESGSALDCQDGSLPIVGADGSYSCDDGSEPECEEGSDPVLSSDGSTIVCQVASGSEVEG
jgi:hypothetical protein